MNYESVLTPEMTLGPFFPQQLLDKKSNSLQGFVDGCPMEKIDLSGCVYDKDKQGVQRCLLEVEIIGALCQNTHTVARTLTNNDGCYQFFIQKPVQAALQLTIFCSGINRLLTVIYFADALPDYGHSDFFHSAGSRQTLLIAQPDNTKQASPGWCGYRFDIRLCGENETPFLLE